MESTENRATLVGCGSALPMTLNQLRIGRLWLGVCRPCVWLRISLKLSGLAPDCLMMSHTSTSQSSCGFSVMPWMTSLKRLSFCRTFFLERFSVAHNYLQYSLIVWQSIVCLCWRLLGHYWQCWWHNWLILLDTGSGIHWVSTLPIVHKYSIKCNTNTR